MNLEEAKEKVRQAVKEMPHYTSEYEIYDEGIIETDFAWYIPFRDIHPLEIYNVLIGAYYGFIVGKVLGDLHQPGSMYRIDKWLAIYELGLLGGPHDLMITKINDEAAAKHSLQRLNLRYYKPEIECGITWKIPTDFTDEMIDEKLANLPCAFKNQKFHFNFEAFKEINSSKAFEYELIKSEDENGYGELIE